MEGLGYLLALPRFEYFSPKTLEEAWSLLERYGREAELLAGGTDLLVAMKKGKKSPRYLIGIKSLSELDFIEYDGELLRIGALATLQSVADASVVQERFGLLATACRKVGTPQVRNMGTLVGNICNAGPSQDTVPSLLVLGAKVKAVSSKGYRLIPLESFFRGPFETVLEDGEMVTEVQIPTPPPHSAGCYRWMTKRTTVDETLVGVAVLVVADPTYERCEDARIALCSVAPTPFRAKRAEALLRGKGIDEGLLEEVGRTAAEETRPRGRAEYRKLLTSLLVRKALTEAWKSLKGQEVVS
ncbi:MAG: xanthine dehydrogenase family protein subunit M [Deltaproteobacteria bacterium]|nr:MAG: xanthine dehydrogenase family protein subunit M [Deltaproteobacteria bacterium]